VRNFTDSFYNFTETHPASQLAFMCMNKFTILRVAV